MEGKTEAREVKRGFAKIYVIAKRHDEAIFALCHPEHRRRICTGTNEQMLRLRSA